MEEQYYDLGLERWAETSHSALWAMVMHSEFILSSTENHQRELNEKVEFSDLYLQVILLANLWKIIDNRRA